SAQALFAQCSPLLFVPASLQGDFPSPTTFLLLCLPPCKKMTGTPCAKTCLTEWARYAKICRNRTKSAENALNRSSRHGKASYSEPGGCKPARGPVLNPPASASEKLAGNSTVSGVAVRERPDRVKRDALVRERSTKVVPRVEMLVLAGRVFFVRVFCHMKRCRHGK